MDSCIEAICFKLHEIFGNDYRYYPDRVEQKLKAPAFIVNEITATIKDFRGNYKSQVRRFDVAYVTDTVKDLNAELANVTTNVTLYFDRLEHPTSKEKFLMFDRSIERSESDLHIMFSIRENFKLIEDYEKMQTLEQKEWIKDGDKGD